jgi:CMP-N-acetylneuraminic acid synthetase
MNATIEKFVNDKNIALIGVSSCQTEVWKFFNDRIN